MVAFGEESWLKQRSPPTSNTHTFIYSKLSTMFYPLREKYTIPVSPQISQNDRLSLQKGVYMEHLMSGIVFPSGLLASHQSPIKDYLCISLLPLPHPLSIHEEAGRSGSTPYQVT